jgi:hypothetical protein
MQNVVTYLPMSVPTYSHIQYMTTVSKWRKEKHGGEVATPDSEMSHSSFFHCRESRGENISGSRLDDKFDSTLFTRILNVLVGRSNNTWIEKSTNLLNAP